MQMSDLHQGKQPPRTKAARMGHWVRMHIRTSMLPRDEQLCVAMSWGTEVPSQVVLGMEFLLQELSCTQEEFLAQLFLALFSQML